MPSTYPARAALAPSLSFDNQMPLRMRSEIVQKNKYVDPSFFDTAASYIIPTNDTS